MRYYIINAYTIPDTPKSLNTLTKYSSLFQFHLILRIPVVIVSRSSQSLFFECLASLDRRPKLALLLTWGVCVLAAD
jgi:hypothetical protein